MKPIFVFFTFVFFQVFGLRSYGQNKVVLEQIQTYSTINPAASYWHLPADLHPILEAFDSGLFASLQMQRETSIAPIVKELKKQTQLKSLGFSQVYVYIGGMFEWLLLQDIYSQSEFPTTTKELDILKFKSEKKINQNQFN